MPKAEPRLCVVVEDLVDAGGIHQLESPADVFRSVGDRMMRDPGLHWHTNAGRPRSPIKSLKFFGM
jgi:hypothetical protein